MGGLVEVTAAFGVVIGLTLGVGSGDVFRIGSGVGLGTRLKVSVSGGGMAGVALSSSSGVTVSSGLIVAVGDGFAVREGLAFGLGVGVGVDGSAVVAGLLAWNGVDAASCARTTTAAVNNTIAKASERIMTDSELLGRR